jgi:glyoxylase-like metal-dependent hydrolase (beta-lactamase superfamily II)
VQFARAICSCGKLTLIKISPFKYGDGIQSFLHSPYLIFMHTALSRRTFLRSATLATIALGLPIVSRSSHAIEVAQSSTVGQSVVANPGYYRFQLGSFELISMSDGLLAVPAAVFAGNATPEQLGEVLQEGFQTETLTPHCNVLYINTGSHKVLIDTGNGTSMGTTAGKLLEQLKAVQIDPIEIDSVIISHAHPDHVNGILDASGGFIFPNAQYYISRVEKEFWLQPNVSLPKIGIDAESQKNMIAVAQKNLRGLGDRLNGVEMGQEIVPGLTAIPAPGHTPGQIAIRIVSGDQSMTHTADVVHISTINLWHPEWQPIFDADPELAVATRQQILSKVAADRELMFAYHFPFPGIGHIRPRSGGGYLWEPATWQLNP